MKGEGRWGLVWVVSGYWCWRSCCGCSVVVVCLCIWMVGVLFIVGGRGVVVCWVSDVRSLVFLSCFVVCVR